MSATTHIPNSHASLNASHGQAQPQRAVSFFASQNAPCAYFNDREERRLVARLDPYDGAASTYSYLAAGGFRRSGEFAYIPACPSCNACQALRVNVAMFRPSKSQLRTLKKNAGLSPRFINADQVTPAHYQLFSSYLASRHSDSEMNHIGPSEFFAMIQQSPISTKIMEWRGADGGLKAACILDIIGGPNQLTGGADIKAGLKGVSLSAVYSFYDPSQPSLSLGSYIILSLIDQLKMAQTDGQSYLYLGYQINDCAQMAYKTTYRPYEIFTPKGWQLVGE